MPGTEDGEDADENGEKNETLDRIISFLATYLP